MTLPAMLDIASVLVFALTGALVASRAQLDIVGFVFVAALTAVGGGTLRDLLLDRPVFWVERPLFVLIAAGAAVVVFFTAHLVESRYRLLVWLDACALAVAVPAGVAVALGLDESWSVTLIMGILTGCLGGLLRDVVCNEMPLALQGGEPYVTCAFAGAGAALVALQTGSGTGTALVLCGAVTLAIRAGALVFGWRIPVYRPRPRRDQTTSASDRRKP